MVAVLESVQEGRSTRDRTLVGSLAELLAEPFEVHDNPSIQHVTSATRYFDTFTHSLDDATDIKNGRNPILMHNAVSELLKGIEEALSCTRNPAHVHDQIVKYWREASEGESYLWKHHGKLIPYNDKDLAMLGKRGAMAKIPLALYSDISQKDRIVAPLETAIENSAVAIQLFDDLLDWKEDLRDSIYTQPIVLAHQHCSSLEEQAVERGLFCSDASAKILTMAQHYFDKGKQYFSISNARSLSELIDTLQTNIAEMQTYLTARRNTSGHGITKDLKERFHPLLLQH